MSDKLIYYYPTLVLPKLLVLSATAERAPPRSWVPVLATKFPRYLKELGTLEPSYPIELISDTQRVLAVKIDTRSLLVVFDDNGHPLSMALRLAVTPSAINANLSDVDARLREILQLFPNLNQYAR
jgi:hypothetical protein